MTSNKRLTVYIGRFSPFHKGHAETITRALKRSDKVLIIIGSSHRPRDIKNPWTFAERALMIKKWYDSCGFTTELEVVSQQDHPYSNQRWLAEVQQHVKNACKSMDAVVIGADRDDSTFQLKEIPSYKSIVEVFLTGSDRDDSTFYLKEFPSYKLDLVTEDNKISQYLSATSIRDIYFGSKLNNRQLTVNECEELNRVFLPETSAAFLTKFREASEFSILVMEHQFQVEHDRRWASAPYAPIFQTVDAVIVQTGHILLVKRRNAPGKGLWALPGGYLNRDEWMLDGAVREAYEETKLDVPKPVLYGSLKDDHTFEAPNRSNRGRIITKAFLFKLPDYVVNGKISLPKVKGEDDAEKAKWFQLSEVMGMSEQLFEDHYDIIETMIARLKEKR